MCPEGARSLLPPPADDKFLWLSTQLASAANNENACSQKVAFCTYNWWERAAAAHEAILPCAAAPLRVCRRRLSKHLQGKIIRALCWRGLPRRPHVNLREFIYTWHVIQASLLVAAKPLFAFFSQRFVRGSFLAPANYALLRTSTFSASPAAWKSVNLWGVSGRNFHFSPCFVKAVGRICFVNRLKHFKSFWGKRVDKFVRFTRFRF